MLKFKLAEAGLVPDSLIRWGIRRMLAERLEELRGHDKQAFIRELKQSPIALVPELANEQHYEVPAEFFATVLGPRLKYSSAFWSKNETELRGAEETMLDLTCQRAALEDGMRVLDLGCGWGSLTLWIAEQYPECRITAVSNSKPQREFILGRCEQEGFDNVQVITADINDFEAPAESFDRVISVEMFEHLRNYELMLERIADWLAPGGKLFTHVFCHRQHAYPYEEEGAGNWMARTFFSGGLMPSEDLFAHFQRDLLLERQWRVGGEHYHKTCEAWLARTDERTGELLPILEEAYGKRDARLWLQRWRLFFIACSEFFAYRGGNEWFVSHCRMAKPETLR